MIVSDCPSTAPEKASGWRGLRDVGVRGVIINRALQMALCSTEAHGDGMHSCSVAASGPTPYLILLDIKPKHKKVIFLYYYFTFNTV